MTKSVGRVAVLLMVAIDPAAAQVFQVPITVSDGLNALVLILGVHPAGSDGFDLGLDQLAPPPAPAGAFDARFRVDSPSEDFLKDIRFNNLALKTFTMLYQAASGEGPIVLTWNASSLVGMGTFEIVDNITGMLFNPPLDMTTTNTLDVSSSPFLAPGLRILVKPAPAVTRYVAPTGSDTGNTCTNQANPCATIGHAVSQANNDDTLNLAAGVYNEPDLVIDKLLHVRGQGIIVR